MKSALIKIIVRTVIMSIFVVALRVVGVIHSRYDCILFLFIVVVLFSLYDLSIIGEQK